MELSELENIWKRQDVKLEESLKLNEVLIKNTLTHTKKYFRGLVRGYFTGRFLNLLYIIISIGGGVKYFDLFLYSIPAFISGLGLFLIFVKHLKLVKRLRRLNLAEMPVVELQLATRRFRLQFIEAGKYDFVVVMFWSITSFPLYLLAIRHFDLYKDSALTLYYFLGCGLITLILIPLNKLLHKKVNNLILENIENQLKEITQFVK